MTKNVEFELYDIIADCDNNDVGQHQLVGQRTINA
jgi:hypothetical protein